MNKLFPDQIRYATRKDFTKSRKVQHTSKQMGNRDDLDFNNSKCDAKKAVEMAHRIAGM